MKCLQNAHTYYFSFTTLKNLLLNAGFQIIAGNEYIKCIIKKAKIKEIEIRNDYEEALKYLRKIEIKRKFLKPYILTQFLILKLKEKIIKPTLIFLGLYNFIKRMVKRNV